MHALKYLRFCLCISHLLVEFDDDEDEGGGDGGDVILPVLDVMAVAVLVNPEWVSSHE